MLENMVSPTRTYVILIKTVLGDTPIFKKFVLPKDISQNDSGVASRFYLNCLDLTSMVYFSIPFEVYSNISNVENFSWKEKNEKFFENSLDISLMYREGFYFSKLDNYDEDGTHWGFYRFNWKNEYGLFDVDFSFNKKKKSFFHSHGQDFRMDIKALK
jgi:hypothetical protein